MSVYFDKLLEQEGKKNQTFLGEEWCDVFHVSLGKRVGCLLSKIRKKRKLAHSLLCSLTRDKDLQVCILSLLFVYHLKQDATWTSMKVISTAMLTGDAIPKVAENTSGWNSARRTREITDLKFKCVAGLIASSQNNDIFGNMCTKHILNLHIYICPS